MVELFEIGGRSLLGRALAGQIPSDHGSSERWGFVRLFGNFEMSIGGGAGGSAQQIDLSC